jgi:ATP-dependent Clp protease ATP-binding subunit ClpA
VNAEPQQTIGIERVLQRAAISALTAEQRFIDGGDVLVAMFREHESDALSVLQQEGITRADLLSYLSHGAGADALGAEGSGVMTQARLSPDVWEALGHYRDERARQLERNVAIGEALNEILRKVLGLPSPDPPEQT